MADDGLRARVADDTLTRDCCCSPTPCCEAHREDERWQSWRHLGALVRAMREAVRVEHPDDVVRVPVRDLATVLAALAAAPTPERPAVCCGKCPETASGGYDCTCEGNPRCAKATPERAASGTNPVPHDDERLRRSGDGERAGAEEVLARAQQSIAWLRDLDRPGRRYNCDCGSQDAMSVDTDWLFARTDDLAALVDLAAGLLTPPTSREELARAWDEGYRRACSDHSTWCRRTDGEHGQRHINPYGQPVETGGEGR